MTILVCFLKLLYGWKIVPIQVVIRKFEFLCQLHHHLNGWTDTYYQGRQTNQVNQCICTTTFSAPPRNFKAGSFCPGEKYLSKVGSWEKLSDQLRNSFPRPVLTYHFLVPIGALEYIHISVCFSKRRKEPMTKIQDAELVQFIFSAVNILYPYIDEGNCK